MLLFTSGTVIAGKVIYRFVSSHQHALAGKTEKSHKDKAVESDGLAVLAAKDEQPQFSFNVHVASFFKKKAEFQEDVLVKGGLVVTGKTVVQGGLELKEQDLDLGTGELTAGNVLYSITAGSGITVSGGQNPTITNAGVLSLQDKTGDLDFTEGDGIDIDGLKFTNTDRGSAQRMFKTITVSGQSDIVAGSNTDTLTFIAGSGVTLTTNATNKSLTIAVSGGGSTQWTTSGLNIYYTSGNVGIGTTNPTEALHIVGNLKLTGTTTFNGITYTWPSADGSSNYVLATNGSGTLSWANVSSLTTNYWQQNGGAVFPSNITNDLLIGGTATSSALVKFAGLSGGNSFITTGGNLGIGTTAPIARFHLEAVSIGKALAILNETGGNNDIFTASSSGLTRFTIANTGTITDTAYDTGVAQFSSGGVLSSAALNLSGGSSYVTGVLPVVHGGTNKAITLSAGGIFYADADSFEMLGAGTSGYVLTSGGTGAPSWTDPSSETFGLWRIFSGTIQPKNQTLDLLLGGTGTLSAKFAVLNLNAGTPTASVSASLGNNATYITGTGIVATTNMQGLTLGGATTGSLSLAAGSSTPALFVANGGNVGIGTTTPSYKLDVSGGTGIVAQFSGRVIGADAVNSNEFVTLSQLQGGTGSLWLDGGDYLYPNSSFANNVMLPSGRLGIGVSSTPFLLEVTGSDTGKALVSLNYTGTDQNILVASQSGITKFSLDNSGRLYLAQSSAPSSTTDRLYNVSGTLYWSGSAISGLTSSQWTTTGSDIFYNSGNVGIGLTTGITHKLHVTGAVTGKALVVLNETGNQAILTASQSGIPVFTINYGGSLLATGDTTNGSTPTSGSGTRMMWIPAKAAFRAGNVGGTHWDNSNIGTYSVAFGQSTKGSGTHSFATGFLTTASGNYSAAFGYGNTASGTYAFVAGGNNSTASGSNSVVLGNLSSANNTGSIVIGERVDSNANNAIVIGTGIDTINHLTSSVADSLSVGFKSTVPTFFVGSGNGVGTYGNVGIGTTSIEGLLKVQGAKTGKALVVLNETGNQAILTASSSGVTKFIIASDGNVGIGTTTTTTSPLAISNLPTGGTTALQVDTDGNVFKASSSLRYKENVQNFLTDFRKILLPSPKKYTYKSTGAGDIGYIAEEFDQLGLTDLVIYDKQGRPDALKYDKISVYMLEVMKDQELRLDSLETLGFNKKASEQLLKETDATVDQSNYVSLPEFQSLEEEVRGLRSRIDILYEIHKASASAITKEPITTAVLSASDSDFLETMVALDKNNATISGSLMVLGRTTVGDIGVTGILRAGVLALDGLEAEINTVGKPLSLQKIGIEEIELFGGKVRFTPKGDMVTTGELTTKKLNLTTTGGAESASVGEAVITKGDTKVLVTTNTLTPSSHIFVTPSMPVAIGAEKVTSNTFIITINQPLTSDLKVSWWVVN